MTDTVAKLRTRIGRLRVVAVALFVVLQTNFNVSTGIPWHGIAISLIFVCVFVALYVCIDLILVRIRSDAPMIALRKAMTDLFLILIMVTTSTPLIIMKFPWPDVMKNFLCFLTYGFVVLVTVQVIQCTRRVLKSDREHLPTTTQPIEPSVESNHHI